jgi:hypothetical protein
MCLSRTIFLLFLMAVALRAAANDLLLYTPHAEVVDFHAALQEDGLAVVVWRTTAEFGVEAFRVWRQDDSGSGLQAVGSGSVAAGGDEAGHAYRLTDTPAPSGTRRRYVLRVISRSRVETDAAVWEGVLLLEKFPESRAAAAGARVSGTVQAAASPLPRQAWIGAGPRVRGWTNALPADRVRLSLRDEGVYGVTAGELATASGWSVADITNALALTNLSLSCQGSPVAWHAEETNLYFYGLAPQSRFAPENVYWVSFGQGSNMLPLARLPGEPATTNQWFMDEVRQQGTNHVSRDGYCSRADFPAPFVGFAPSIPGGGGKLVVTQPLVDCAPGVWTGAVTVSLISYYDAGTDDHTGRVSVGGVQVGALGWSGEQYLSFSYPFSSTDGVASIQIENTGNADIFYRRILCLSCACVYPRSYLAQNGALRCTGGENNTVAVSGFSTNDLLALDVTSAALPRMVEPVALACDAASGKWSASFPCGGTGSVYAVVSKSTGVRQPSVRGVRNLDWTSPASAADYVILVPPEGWRDDIRPVLQPLADYRNAQGLHTVIADVETVYNQFSHGLVDPQAIRAFCGAGYTNWPGHPLRYVLLAGAGSLDFKHDWQSVNSYTACLIPTIIGGQQFSQSNEGMIVALDQAFGDVTGDAAPEVILGRLPTTRTQDMAVAVQKTIAYEGALLWKQQVAVAADWDNVVPKQYPFSVATDQFIGFLQSAGRTVVKSYYNLYPDPDLPGNMAPTRVYSLFPAFTTGSGVFHFFGHSSDTVMGYNQNLLIRSFISASNWTNAMIAIIIGCRVNRWQFITEDICILSCGIFAPNTGFVAALGATGYMLADEGESLGVALYSQAAANGTLRLGDVLKNGLQQMAGSMPPERLQCFCLTGDPALVFRHDITSAGTPVSWLAQHGLTAPNADLADADHDGWSAAQEYLAGTSPTSCVLRITSAGLRPADNRLTIGFEAGTSGTYRVFHKASLTDAADWEPLPWALTNALDWSLQAILPAAPIAVVDVPATNAAAVQGFYRVCWTN